jgi:hypothetical protein
MTKELGRLAHVGAPAADDSSDITVAITAVRICMLVRRRTAWGRTIRRYDNDGDFFKFATYAQWAAESRRETGLEFEVQELPALRIDGKLHSVLIACHSPGTPFREWVSMTSSSDRSQLRAGATVGTAVTMLRRHSQVAEPAVDRSVALALPLTSTIPHLDSPGLRRWESWAKRPRLDWTEMPVPYFSGAGAIETAQLFDSQSARSSSATRRRASNSSEGGGTRHHSPTLRIV